MAIRPALALLACAAMSLAATVVPAHAAPTGTGLPAGQRWTGTPQKLGRGSVSNVTVTRDGVPHALGVTFDAAALEGLPMDHPTDGTHCYDVNGDGAIDHHRECVGGHEQRLTFPERPETAPYRWTMLNWNPMGHSGHVYGKPHFDFHFYLATQEETDAIRMGPCSELVNCDDWVIALQPLPAQYLPKGYVAPPEAVEGAMGAHLVDPASPAGDAFTRTFIYGQYAGRVTFLEPMITVEHLRRVASLAKPGRPGEICDPIAQPAAWQRRGWYPQRSCVRYESTSSRYFVTLEGFRRG